MDWLASSMGPNAFTKWLEAQAEASRQRQQLRRICQQAMRWAEQDLASSPLRLEDIGLLGYRNPTKPKLIRLQPVISDTQFIRPFVQLYANRPLEGTLRLEIRDDQQALLYLDSGFYRLRRHVRIIPKTWLPLRDHRLRLEGEWWIMLWFRDEPLAAHPFGWERLADSALLAQLRTDGEISDELRQDVQRGRFRKMSLSELLADQEE